MSVTFAAVTLHVANVWKTVCWYENVFGFAPRFLAPDGSYAELATPGVVLALSSNELEAQLLPAFRRNTLLDDEPPGLHLTLASASVADTFAKALQHGALAIHKPLRRPWGRLEACVRDPNGILLRLVTEDESTDTPPKQLTYWNA